ncbi:uncharacterized protein KY384_005203 [Bacidia gigantensis]|uniref:uncharacterized protein n=1 Tax=Bacidia gigantensis TaxID=2732470 RepID=UPI001D05C0B8|nr:uncharacterized protein KY384_005203 [Bacidia gigantensis]KAG8529722.1 hypothetical protein KY384_005203 [Bacidia gigantensis]
MDLEHPINGAWARENMPNEHAKVSRLVTELWLLRHERSVLVANLKRQNQKAKEKNACRIADFEKQEKKAKPADKPAMSECEKSALKQLQDTEIEGAKLKLEIGWQKDILKRLK